MFRISGENLDIETLLASISIPVTMSFKKGEPRFRKKPDGKKNEASGAAFDVSTADFNDFEQQKRDAIAFLKTRELMIRKVMNWPGVQTGELDFGIWQRDVMVQCDRFPAELLRLAGGLGLDIELSRYPKADENPKPESQPSDAPAS